MAKQITAAAVAVLLVLAAAYGALFVAPAERSMGLIQRIFYLHVSSAWTAFTAFFITFVANLLYIFRRRARWDWLGVASAEVGLAFTTIVLVTGPIWAHPVWGIWWTWDARLTSTFVLWLLYVSYLLLPTLLDVPLVFGAIRWWRTQHPQPLILGAPGSGLDPRMRNVLLFCWLAMLGVMTVLMRARYQLEAMRGELEAIQREAEAA